MSPSPVVTPAILDKFIGLLVPLFLAGVGGDMTTARHAAARMLAAYNTETEAELSLAAEIVCFSFGALEALSNAMNPDLTPNAVLRLRGSANALHRSAHQCQRTLERLRKQRSQEDAARIVANPIPEPPPVETLQLSEYAQTTLPDPMLGLSRQQRRAAQRKLEKRQRQQAEQERREAMRAARRPPASSPPVASPPNHPGQSTAA